MNRYKVGIVFLLLNVASMTKPSDLGHYFFTTLLVGATSADLLFFQDSIEKLRWHEKLMHEDPELQKQVIVQYNLEIAKSNVAITGFSAIGLAGASVRELWGKPWTFWFALMKMVTALNLCVGACVAADFCELEDKYKKLDLQRYFSK